MLIRFCKSGETVVFPREQQPFDYSGIVSPLFFGHMQFRPDLNLKHPNSFSCLSVIIISYEGILVPLERHILSKSYKLQRWMLT